MQLQSSSTYRSMRSSLYPFIRDPMPDEDANSAYTNVEHSERRPRSNLLERYHDVSYVIKARPSNSLQKYIHILNAISKKFIHEEYDYASKYQQSLTFNPQATPLYIWNILVVLSIIYHFFQIPICLFFTERAFHSQFRSGFGITCNVVSLIVLLINMIYVIPNTQYYHNGFLVTKHEKIIQRYIGWRLLIDVIAYVSLFVFVVSNTYHLIYFKLLFYFMAYRLDKVDDLLQRKIQLTKVRLAAYKLMRIILIMFFLVLWLASIFFAIDYHYYLQGENATYTGTQLWLTASTATNSIDIIQGFDDWAVWLDYSLYWSFQTVSMVGFGDLTPKNPVEVTYTSIVITCVVVSFAFFITGVWQIVAEARQHHQFKNHQWKIYKEYQKQNMKPLDRSKQGSQKGIKYRQLKNKVGSYLFEMWNNQKANSEINIVKVLEKSLTPELKDQVFINYRKNLFERIQLFQQLSQAEPKNYKYIFRSLIFKITQKKYAKHEAIIQFGSPTKNLIYLVNGILSIKYPNSNYKRSFKQNFNDSKGEGSLYVVNNDNFGVKHFFTQQAIPYSVVSQSFCKTSQLSHQDFIRSIREVDEFYVKYCELRDRLKLYNMEYLAGEECIQCGSNEHELSQCEQCDVSMCYKRHWMRMGLLSKMPMGSQNRQKSGRTPIRRPIIKSTKVMNPQINRQAQHLDTDEIRSFKFYQPQYNFAVILK